LAFRGLALDFARAPTAAILNPSCRDLDMKPGILLMARELHHGGSERQLTEVALGLDRTLYQPYVGAFRLEGIRADDLRAAGVPILHVPVHSFKSPVAATAGLAMARYIRANHIRLVHTFDMPLTGYAIPITRALTSAVALASQRCHLSLANPHLRKLVLFAERRAHGVVVNCEYVKRHLMEDAGIKPERIHLCYNGLDLTRFRRAPANRPPSLPADALVVGVVCVLRPEKGLDTLVEAFARVRPMEPNLRLAIIGSGPMLPELERLARELGVMDACIFEPSNNRVEEWMRVIDIFVQPSLNEALSNSLMEAMACGCCPIASRVGGNPELVEDGVRGLLFEPGDSEDLARKLREVITNRDLRIRLADAAHDFLHAHFSRANSARRMTEIYAKLIGSAKSGHAASAR
jgi:glycosyltransferase involved in cell wall biosynthesis